MKINLLSKNIEITGAIREYVEKKVTNLSKLLLKAEENGADIEVYFEVGKSTKHHKGGEYFHSDCSVMMGGDKFYASSDKEDLYEAIDEVKEDLFRQIEKKKDREQTLIHRGARSIKKMMKGLSNRNPFTSKY